MTAVAFHANPYRRHRGRNALLACGDTSDRSDIGPTRAFSEVARPDRSYDGGDASGIVWLQAPFGGVRQAFPQTWADSATPKVAPGR